MGLFPRVVELLAAADAADIVVFGGGVIPDDDVDSLRAAGLAAIFTPGSPLAEITGWVESNVRTRGKEPE
jgi:methylmalonyl-CoA mutase C-terminal domain/subunit